MRDPNRLNDIYLELMEIHKRYAPDIRFGQLMHNFTRWLELDMEKDIFYIGDDKIMKYMKQYLCVED
jgi:hypothetical protein